VDGQSREELDNFHHCQMQIDGQIWPSSEHYFQACKFPNDMQHREAIRMAPSGMDCWKLGQAKDLRSDWEEVKVEMMYQANLAKFSQNPHLGDVLVNSSGAIQAQGNPEGWKTWNEVLLERIREELRDDDRRNVVVLEQRIASMAAYKAAARAKDEYGMKVATQYALKRMPMPDSRDNSVESLVVAGAGKDLDGLYRIDLLAPEHNGQSHYCRREGGHLYLGVKNGRSAWVLDEVCSPSEATGEAFLSATAEGSLPLGQLAWQGYDDEARLVERIVSVQVQ